MDTGEITAVAAAIVAVLGAITAFIVALRPMLADILAELRGSRAELAKNTRVTEDTHVMINSQRDAAVLQQTKTDNLLRAAGIPLPFNPAAGEQVAGTGPETPPAWPPVPSS